MANVQPTLEEIVPTATPIDIRVDAKPIIRIEEGVVTPNGTKIRRRCRNLKLHIYIIVSFILSSF